ncbi:MAG TPA: thiamine pyrophosphate-dependent enzyme [Candidatus Kapabacteria bacterium]|nr:thiamine pyrophosphate-dependent enzyme [Candidatus Kapabacteria bacterium]
MGKKLVLKNTAAPKFDWLAVARTVLTSRAIDKIEETELVPQGLVTYQFSARGHDMIQAILAEHITHPHDGAAVYYRSRPFVLAQGLTPEESMAASMARSGGVHGGRDIGVVHFLRSRGKATVLPASGDVGAQYSPAIGWAQAVQYYTNVLNDESYRGAIAVALGGDGSVAANGFWAALNAATTQKLPLLFFIENNGYGISVTGDFQTPGANIAKNLASFGNLKIWDGDGTKPEEAEKKISEAVGYVREWNGPALIHLTIPRLEGHSFVDTQSYKSKELLESERANDPLEKLKKHLLGKVLSPKQWESLEKEVEAEVIAARDRALASPHPDPATAYEHVFSSAEIPINSNKDEGIRMNLQDAVRKTLEVELEKNDKLLVFGEDVGAKGGVHGATVDLQIKFGKDRVFDTSLSEEGIIGRSVGMAFAGLKPVPEIQFRKYADPATEQINDAGTVRWRTKSQFVAGMVVRIPAGFAKKTGDPWHSVSGEATFAHQIGWRIAFPSNAEDAVGLLRTALRSDDPTFFFEHRALLDTPQGRANYPGDEYMVPFGKAKVVREGSDATIITWGAMVSRAVEAAEAMSASIEILDLRTVMPWDKEAVLSSVKKTNRMLVLCEDNWTANFAAEICTTITQDAFEYLDAPVERLSTPDIPIPYNVGMMDAVLPGVEVIKSVLQNLLAY